ncbi:MAG TPA: plasmid pRiA4b ORF-3 family protein [Synergistaceae bacterium]|nr:plasmid pRiA4b ORF-3 family protein [Synergistaceae bacterium]
MSAHEIKIELKDFEPLIWRKVVIPTEMTFENLHMVIQIAMGWQDYHLYSFEIPDINHKIVCDEDVYDDLKVWCKENQEQLKRGETGEYIKKMAEMKVKKSWNTEIDTYIKKVNTFQYTYDFGDYWEHLITFEVTDEDWKVSYPVVVEGKGACPPEDVGGIGGYERFLRILKNTRDPDHRMMKEWGESQLYRPFSRKATNYALIYAFKLLNQAGR